MYKSRTVAVKKSLSKNLTLLYLLQRLLNLNGKIDGLSTRQALDFEFQSRLMYELDLRIKKENHNQQKIISDYSKELKERISKYYSGSIYSLGISEKSLDRKYRIWRNTENDKKIRTLRFYSLIQDKSYALNELGLNGDVVRNFFKIIDKSIDEWAIERKLSPEKIRHVLHNRRVCRTEEAKALRDSIKQLRKKLSAERRNLLCKIQKDTKNLTIIENNLVLLNALKCEKRATPIS